MASFPVRFLVFLTSSVVQGRSVHYGGGPARGHNLLGDRRQRLGPVHDLDRGVGQLHRPSQGGSNATGQSTVRSSARQVHSISYGGVERETPALHRFNKDLALLAVRGITVVVSSGDDGVGNFPIRDNPQACGLNPSFPASCPYVVSVGATQGPESGQPEISCSSDTGGIITSGGGFSTVFPAPSYQAGAVRRFLLASKSDDLPPDEMFNRSGRGYPDVALLGYNYIVTDGGQFVAESGTSASGTLMALVIADSRNRPLTVTYQPPYLPAC